MCSWEAGPAEQHDEDRAGEPLDGGAIVRRRSRREQRHHGAQPPSIVVDLMLQACEGIAEGMFGLVRQESNSRSIRYTTHAYSADKPHGSRYG